MGRLAVVLLFAVIPAVAQQVPRLEIFGGYSHLALDSSARQAKTENGWNAALNYNLKSWLGIKADFGGSYGSIQFSSLGLDFATNSYTFLFGPQLASRTQRTSVFAHTLIGGVRHSTGRGLNLPGAHFGFALGGGIDINATGRIALRLFQADYLRSNQEVGVVCIQVVGVPCPTSRMVHLNNARIGTGVVFRLGGSLPRSSH